jgi:ricin-type beta-trefoil lectin protein
MKFKTKKETIVKISKKLKVTCLRAFGALPLLGVLAACLGGPANAAILQINAAAPYVCAAVQGGNTTPGTAVIAYSCSGAPNDQWNYFGGQFLGLGSGANGATTCLDVKDSGTTSGTLVDLNTCTGGQNQQWKITNGENLGLSGLTLIVGTQSGLCLDSSGGPGVGGGTQLVVNTCTGTGSQNWIAREMLFELDASSPYTCFSVNGADIAQGTPVITYSCDGGPGELWNYEQGQLYGIGTNGESHKCLTPAGHAVGSLVVLDKCNGKTTQQWIIETIGDAGGTGTADLVANVQSGLCLDSSGGPPVGGGTQLVTNACTGAASQNWLVR